MMMGMLLTLMKQLWSWKILNSLQMNLNIRKRFLGRVIEFKRFNEAIVSLIIIIN